MVRVCVREREGGGAGCTRVCLRGAWNESTTHRQLGHAAQWLGVWLQSDEDIARVQAAGRAGLGSAFRKVSWALGFRLH